MFGIKTGNIEQSVKQQIDAKFKEAIVQNKTTIAIFDKWILCVRNNEKRLNLFIETASENGFVITQTISGAMGTHLTHVFKKDKTLSE